MHHGYCRIQELIIFLIYINVIRIIVMENYDINNEIRMIMFTLKTKKIIK